MKASESGIEYRRQVKISGLILFHFVVSVGLFAVFWFIFRYGKSVPWTNVNFRYNYFVILGYGAVLFFFNKVYNSYLLGFSRIRELVISEFMSQLFSVAAIYVLVSLGWSRWNNPVWFAALIAAQGVLNVIWAYVSNIAYFRIHPPKKTILIYRNALDKRRFGNVTGKPAGRIYRIESELMYNGGFDGIKDKLDGFDAIFVAGLNSGCRNGILKYCQDRNKPVFFLPHIGDVIVRGSTHIQSFDSPVLYVTRSAPSPEYRVIKRAFDIVSSLIGIIVLSPVMLVTALAIKLYDGGPAIYKQVRLTRGGKEFRILKFRSMRVDAEKDGVARLSTGDRDDRITPIGRFVRKCRLDELPQLFNILKGDMSVVGPRPERPEIAEQYCASIPDFRLRLQVKAGLTGYAQIYGKYNTDPYEKLEFDLLYINDMSVLTDLKLMFATIRVLFSSESTKGVEGVTAMDDAGGMENE
ncbi:MAG: sugar transferase [Clostridia bacterium]|nr:sugar transferase [Clostridia bacterium]